MEADADLQEHAQRRQQNGDQNPEDVHCALLDVQNSYSRKRTIRWTGPCC